jgi:hypothetical protein
MRFVLLFPIFLSVACIGVFKTNNYTFPEYHRLNISNPKLIVTNYIEKDTMYFEIKNIGDTLSFGGYEFGINKIIDSLGSVATIFRDIRCCRSCLCETSWELLLPDSILIFPWDMHTKKWSIKNNSKFQENEEPGHGNFYLFYNKHDSDTFVVNKFTLQ